MTTLYRKSNVGETILSADRTLEHEAEEIDELFQHSFEIVAPEAKEAMEALLSLNNKDIGIYNWVMPDGFKVKYDVKSKHEINIAGITKGGIAISFNQEVKRYAPSEFIRGISPNVIHSFDGYVLRRVKEMFKHFLTTIHDALGVHYNYADELRTVYKNVMIELLENDYLKDVMESIAGHEVNSMKKGTLTRADIENSLYFLS